jgi:hypothetical protein
MRIACVLILLSACFKSGGAVTGTLATGAIATRDTPELDGIALGMTERESITGVELRAVVAGRIDEPYIPNAYGFTVRQVGEGVQSSVTTGWMLASRVGSSTVFARVMFDLLSTTKRGDDETLSALSPTADFGIAPWGRGICIAGSGTWDVRFNQQDRGLIGVFIGLCGGPLGRRE